MVKKISVFITILGLFFLGIPQFNSKALIYNGVDYRVLETGLPMEVDNMELNPIIINEEQGGATLAGWLNYMQYHDIHRVEMQASNLSTFYIYFTNENSTVDIATNVFKVVVGYDTGVAYFYMHLYGLNQVLIEEYVFMSSANQWSLPSDSRVLTNVNFMDGSNLYTDGYNDGYDVGIDEGYNNGYDDGYNDGINETDTTGFNTLLIAVFSGLGAMLAIEILPGIYIGAILAVPLVFGIISFLLNKRKDE